MGRNRDGDKAGSGCYTVCPARHAAGVPSTVGLDVRTNRQDRGRVGTPVGCLPLSGLLKPALEAGIGEEVPGRGVVGSGREVALDLLISIVLPEPPAVA